MQAVQAVGSKSYLASTMSPPIIHPWPAGGRIAGNSGGSSTYTAKQTEAVAFLNAWDLLISILPGQLQPRILAYARYRGKREKA